MKSLYRAGFIFLSALATAVLPALGVDVAWQGPTSGTACWTNTANWAGGALPTASDRAVFGSDVETLSLSMANLNSKALPLHDISVAAGTVKICSGGANVSMPAGTNVYDVAAGATLIVESNWTPYGSNKSTIEKRGLGVLQGPAYNGSYLGYTNNRLKELHVCAGTTTFPGFRQYISLFTIESGATNITGSISATTGFEVYDIKKGGYCLVNVRSAAPAGFRGDGTLAISYGGASSFKNFGPNLYGGPYRFNGTIVKYDTSADYTFLNYAANSSYPSTGDARHFVIGASNTLAGLSYFIPKITPEWGRGVGEFWTASISGTSDVPVPTADEDGQPITLHAAIGANTAVTGPGSWFARGTTTVTGTQVRVTGEIGSDAGIVLTLGNGTAAGDVDVNGFTAVRANGGVTYNLGAELHQTVPLAIGNKGFTVKGAPATFESVKATGKGGMAVGKNVTVKGGDMRIGNLSVVSGTSYAATTVTLSRVHLYSTRGDNYRISEANPQNPPNLVIENGGGFYHGGGSASQYNGDITLRSGGRIGIFRGSALTAAQGAQSIYADGGIIDARFESGYGNSLFPADTDAKNWTVRVRKGGLWYESDIYRENYVKESGSYTGLAKAVTDVTDGKDGGITLALAGPTTVDKVQNPSGGVTLADGWVRTALTGAPLGTGDLTFDGGHLSFTGSADQQLTFAGGSGSKVRLVNSGLIDFRRWNNAWVESSVAETVTLGAPDETGSPIERTAGGVLQIARYALTNSAHRLLVRGTLAQHADGRLKLPIYLSNVSDSTHFTTYDATDGIVQFTNYVGWADIATAAGKTLQMVGTGDCGKTLAADAAVGAIRFAMSGNNWKFITIPSGKTLTVGNGTDPAPIIANGGWAGSTTLFTGEGTLDFGTSEGVIAVGCRNNTTYTGTPAIDVKMSGSGGVTYAGSPSDMNAVIYVKKASDYTGGTHIGNVSVSVYDGAAFGTGRVTARGARFMDHAGVNFQASDLTFANDFTLRGRGLQKERNGYHYGAFYFASPRITLNGAIEIDRFARFTASGCAAAAHSGLFNGVISGGRLELLDCASAPFVFTRDNTYAGGTEIGLTGANTSKVILRGAKPSLGTGEILIRSGVIQFENTETLAFTNAMRGVATFVLAGEPEVKFGGDYDNLTATVKLANGSHVFTELPPFGNLVGPDEGRTKLVFPNDLGTVAWNGTALTDPADGVQLEIGEGTLLDLGGATLTVRTAKRRSAGRVVNGTLIETHPQVGTAIFLK